MTMLKLDPFIVVLGEQIRVEADGLCRLPEDVVTTAAEQLLRMDAHARVAEHIVAYMLHCRRVAGARAAPALGQLALLLSLIVGEARASAVVAGFDLRTLAKTTGFDTHALPSQRGEPAGMSPLRMRIDAKRGRRD